MIEKWKDIKGYEGLYQVSNLGRIKGKKILKQSFCTRGYNSIRLFDNGNKKSLLVHRLIAKAFIPNPENKPCINHKNGIKTDNRACNLEWSTYKENTAHSYEVLGRKGSPFGKFGKDHNSSKAVFQYTKEGDFVAEYGSQKEAHRETGIHHVNISSVCRQKSKTAGGYIWKFKNV